MMSGMRIDLSKFREGWALVGSNGKAHYFTRSNKGFRSDCGLVFKPELRDRKGFVAFDPGSFPKCLKCKSM